ncbi:MAG: glutamine synthetase GlnII [Actinomycetota bacterium]
MAIKAEYIWTDGTEPTAALRSKTKILADDASTAVGDLPIWGFDGSSTNQATGDKSDCVLKPVASYPDPLRGGDNVLVMCEVMLVDGKAHPTNTRAAAARTAKKYKKHEPLFGIEQEYTMLRVTGEPLGFPEGGYPGPQGPYYCGVGELAITGRSIAEEHLEACLSAGLSLSGINAEVMPGQWEFQVGPLGLLEVGDQLWVARWLLHRIAEDYGVVISTDPKPMKGDWNGAGCHTNYSTIEMREDGGYKVIEEACKALGKKADLHIKNYGVGIEDRLTGAHETQRFDQFSYGVSDRGASIRIPWQVAQDKKGYLEDRRPNGNMDPYVVARLITDTTCAAMK